MWTLIATWFARGLLSGPLLAVALGQGDTDQRKELRLLGTVAALALVALGVRQVLRQVQWSLAHPIEWDFLCFWVFGKAVWLGRDPYDPASFRDIVLPLTPSAEFRSEVLELGALYPPPAMLLFGPLGAFDFHTAQLLWYGLHLLAGVGCAILAGQLFFTGSAARRGLFGAALLLALPLTTTTLAFAQTNLLLLLFVLLAVRSAERPASGVWIALAVAVKPWVAILGLVPLLRRDWPTVRVMVGAGVALLLASLALLGPESFFGFVSDSPEARAPAHLFSQPVNQSLFAVALRLGAERGAAAALALQGLAIAAAASVVATSLWLVHRRLRAHPSAAYSLLLPAGLLIYPSALWHYSLALALPFGWLWSRCGRPGRWPHAVAWALALLIVVTGQRDVQLVWAANAATWLLVASGTKALPGAEA